MNAGSAPGVPSFQADLADPNSVPNEALLEPVDACLRLVVLALLEGCDVAAASEQGAESKSAPTSPSQLVFTGPVEVL